jgi:two-component system nitrogen regulation sensor histidine kinase GlnL
MLIEFRHIEQQLRIAREQQLLDGTQASRELIRNLAHEIRNPLGGIRGAAQLLARELERPELHDYTGVIMKEVDRLQSLMDRLLTPHRLPKPVPLNIHEALERVRMLIVAEAPLGVSIERDYDVSLPDIVGDMEQIIQALLNVVRNAVQAVQSGRGAGRVVLRTRVVRQITLARRRYRHAIAIQVIDDGPGIPDAIRDHIFYPLVSGRKDGSGLGLSLAQTFVAQHHGTIEVESQPGHTCFTILLPVETGETR